MWTAVSLAATFVAGAIAYAWWAWGAAQGGVSYGALVALGLVLYAMLFFLVTAGWFLLAWVYRARRPPEAQLGPRASWRLFWNEWLTLMGSGWRMGFAWWLMREPAPAPAQHPIVLVHGVLCNAAVWLGMRGMLARLGLGPLYTISYGPPLASIETFADALARKIEDVIAATGAQKVTLVGHSMGGLVSRAYLRRYPHSRVRGVITLGTPHSGSVHAWLFPGISLGQLRRGNPWLLDLNDTALPDVPMVSIWSWHDSMVAPQDSAILPGARNVAVIGVGHNAMLRDAEVARLVASEAGALAKVEREPATSGSRG